MDRGRLRRAAGRPRGGISRGKPLRLLLDTHVFLWAIDQGHRLTAGAQDAIASGANTVFVSAAAIWEIEIKRSLGKIVAPEDLCAAAFNSSFQVLAITAQHAVAAARLPRHHGDPFDRMLVAQTMAADCVLVTRDKTLSRHDVATFPA